MMSVGVAAMEFMQPRTTDTGPRRGDIETRLALAIIGPERDHCGRITHDNHYRKHRRIRARIEHVTARRERLAHPASIPSPRPTHQPQPPNIAGLWNIKAHNKIRANS
jgi:hypothetical protein